MMGQWLVNTKYLAKELLSWRLQVGETSPTLLNQSPSKLRIHSFTSKVAWFSQVGVGAKLSQPSKVMFDRVRFKGLVKEQPFSNAYIFPSVVSTRLDFFSGGETRRVTDALFKEDIAISAKNLLIDMSCMKRAPNNGIGDGRLYHLWGGMLYLNISYISFTVKMVYLYIIKCVPRYRLTGMKHVWQTCHARAREVIHIRYAKLLLSRAWLVFCCSNLKDPHECVRPPASSLSNDTLTRTVLRYFYEFVLGEDASQNYVLIYSRIYTESETVFHRTFLIGREEK